MSLAQSATRLFLDERSSYSVSVLLRRRRWANLLSRFPDLGEMHVLDLGGTEASWRLSPVRPAHLTLLNVVDQESTEAEVLVGDACEPPASLRARRFDFIYTNSVIAHVGGHYRREQFAETVHTLADHHWVQTPNRGFPVEPLFLFPGIYNLPLPLAVRLARRWPLGRYAGKLDTDLDAMHALFRTEPLGVTHMHYYFPDSNILRERVGPLTKSLIAWR